MASPQLVQSRETGNVLQTNPFAKSWAHFVAGGLGGMTAAALTAPLDVLKTRLQSDLYHRPSNLYPSRSPLRAGLYHLRDTIRILVSVYRLEGPRALFKGLGPNLVGVVPARSINFYAYGNGKRLLADHLNGGREAAWVHLSAAVLAGVATSTATNPIWLVKTRLQLDRSVAERAAKASGVSAAASRRYRNSWDCVRQVVRAEGVRGLYKGMSASYLGVAESTLHWVLYEQMKRSLARRQERVSARAPSWWDHTVDWTGKFGAAGCAKLVAAVLTYPHEVARTRLRQAPLDGRPKYTGLVQCFRLVFREEGMAGLYGGMTPHLLRTVPSAAVMFAMYEGILRLLG